jgi:hypothetical protein
LGEGEILQACQRPLAAAADQSQCFPDGRVRSVFVPKPPEFLGGFPRRTVCRRHHRFQHFGQLPVGRDVADQVPDLVFDLVEQHECLGLARK